MVQMLLLQSVVSKTSDLGRDIMFEETIDQCSCVAAALAMAIAFCLYSITF
jgi:hypothetical protein